MKGFDNDDRNDDSQDLPVISPDEISILCKKAIKIIRCENDDLRLIFMSDYKAHIYILDNSFTFVRDGNHENTGFLRDISPLEFCKLLPDPQTL